jgi:uncharacterized protein involved in exopolysaccharide biosynthesis
LEEAREVSSRTGASPKGELDEIFDAIRRFWVLLLLAMAVGFVLAYVGSFLIEPRYRAVTVVTPADSSNDDVAASVGGRLGGLASLAGINLAQGRGDNTAVGLAMLQSRSFLSQFARDEGLDIVLIAAKGWNEQSGNWEIDPQVYDVAAQKWIPNSSNRPAGPPTDWQLHREFMRILKVDQDPVTGLVTIAMDLPSRDAAQRWLGALVQTLNEHIRLKDIELARKRAEYLEIQLARTSLTELRMALFQLVEQQARTIMLAEVSDEYVFRTIDRPVASDEPVAPLRLVMAIVGSLFGLVLASLFAIWLHFRRS